MYLDLIAISFLFTRYVFLFVLGQQWPEGRCRRHRHHHGFDTISATLVRFSCFQRPHFEYSAHPFCICIDGFAFPPVVGVLVVVLSLFSAMSAMVDLRSTPVHPASLSWCFHQSHHYNRLYLLSTKHFHFG